MASQEEHFSTLVRQLRAWNGRRRLQAALVWLPRSLLAGLLAAALVAALARFQPLLTNREVGLLALVLAAVGLLAGLVWLLAQRVPLPQQARFADRQFHLQERARTAVEIQHGLVDTTPRLAAQQLADTLTAVQKVDAKTQFPFTIQRQDWLLLLITALLLATAVWLPNRQEEILISQRAIEKSIEEQINQLEALSEQIQQNPNLTDAQKEKILAPVEDAIAGLGEGSVSQEQAVAALSEAEAELRDLAAGSNAEQLRQQLQQAGESLANNPQGQTLGEALQNGNLAQAGAAAAQLADQLPQLSREEQLALAQDLMETAQGLVGTDDQLAQQLAAAAQALQNGDTAAAQQALREAGATLQQRTQEAAAAQQANQAADALNQGRQEVAEAGQGQGPGQPANPDNLLPPSDGRAGPNEGLGQGPDSGQGQGPGQGEGNGSGEGNGEGNGQGQGPGQGQNNGGNGQLGGPGPGGGHVENVYAPEFRDLSGTEGVDIELPAECVADPSACGALLNETPTEFTDEASLVPYTQVFGDYRNAANEALQDDYIPLGLKGYVRDYFSSLEP